MLAYRGQKHSTVSTARQKGNIDDTRAIADRPFSLKKQRQTAPFIYVQKRTGTRKEQRETSAFPDAADARYDTLGVYHPFVPRLFARGARLKGSLYPTQTTDFF